jgi:hypothetical protein
LDAAEIKARLHNKSLCSVYRAGDDFPPVMKPSLLIP